MLRTREDYVFVSQNAIRRIAIKGQPYPVREQKLVVTGEDVAYLREAVAERRYLLWWAVQADDSVILEITQAQLRAKWIYDLIEPLYRLGYWLDEAAARSYGVMLPQGAVVQINGELTSTRPQAVAQAIAQCAATENAANDAYDEGADDAFDALTEGILALYEARDSGVESAAETRDAAKSATAAQLESDLEEMKARHVAELERLLAEYEAKIQEPDADIEAEREKYERAVESENTAYEVNVAKRKDKAARDSQEADNAYADAVWHLERQVYESSVSLYAEYSTAIKNLKTQRDGTIAAAQATRNQTVETEEKNVLYTGYLQIGADSMGNVSISGDGVSYSDALSQVSAGRDAIKLPPPCLQHYLRKTQLAVERKNAQTLSEHIDFAAHAPASDATMRAFADLERLTCLAAAEMRGIYVYRSAHYETTNGVVEYFDETRDRTYYNFDIEQVQIGNRDYTTAYSNTEFAVYFGRREELGLVKAVYATVKVARVETLYNPNDETLRNRSFGCLRVQLVNQGVQAQDDLDDIDEIRDQLAEDIAQEAEMRDIAYNAAQTAYNAAEEQADKVYAQSEETAQNAYRAALAQSNSQCVTNLLPHATVMNARVIDAENADIPDEVREARIKAAEDAFDEQRLSALAGKSARDEAAQEAYVAAVSEADRARREAIDDAEEALNQARSDADDAYDNAVAALTSVANGKIEQIKERPAQRREQAAQAKTQADAAAGTAWTNALDALSSAFDTALHSLTVGGNPILPDHAEYLQDTASFPYVTLTTDARDIASDAEEAAFDSARQTAYNGSVAAENSYRAALRQNEQAYWAAKAQIQDIREDARCRWAFVPAPIDSRIYGMTPGEANKSYYDTVWMAGLVDLDVVYEPKSLTGTDFSDYYEEAAER